MTSQRNDVDEENSGNQADPEHVCACENRLPASAPGFLRAV